MKALYFETTGKPSEVLALGDFEKPVAGPGELVVRMVARPVNPSDFFFMAGQYRIQPQFPQIAGLEGTGVVDSAGENVRIKPGTPVAFFSKNTWAEYTLVAAENVITLPIGFPVEKAAQFTLNPITAWGLLERSLLKTGEWLLLTAGSSVVSKLVIQIAVSRGIRVIATVRTEKYRPELEQYGANVIHTGIEDLVASVQELTGGEGVKAAIDAVGGALGAQVIKCLGMWGQLIVYSRLSDDPSQFRNADILYKNLSISGFGIRSYFESKTPAERDEIAVLLAELISGPEFKMKVAGIYELQNYQDAINAAQGSPDGKILLVNN